MKTRYRKTILRIVKKSIYTNFIYFYSKHGLFISAIFNIVIINLNFLLFPQLLYKARSFDNYSEYNDHDNDNEAKNEINNIPPHFKIFNFNNSIQIIFRIINNLLDFIALSVINN